MALAVLKLCLIDSISQPVLSGGEAESGSAGESVINGVYGKFRVPERGHAPAQDAITPASFASLH
jgi:hypothetical protein